MNKLPLQRASWLRPIARDHGVALLCAHFAWKAIRAPHTERLIFAAQIRILCQNSILDYLEDEQWVLTPLIADANLRYEFHRRHSLIKLLIEELNKISLAKDPGLGLLASLADVLDGCVRWEENELFPRIEAGLERAQLHTLSEMTARIEKNRHRPTQVRQKQLRSFNMAANNSGIRAVSANIYAFNEDARNKHPD